MELFFYYNSIPPEMKLFTTSFYLSGEPLQFFYGLHLVSLLSTWEKLAEQLELRFGNFIWPTVVLNVWEADEPEVERVNMSVTGYQESDREEEEEINASTVEAEEVAENQGEGPCLGWTVGSVSGIYPRQVAPSVGKVLSFPVDRGRIQLCYEQWSPPGQDPMKGQVAGLD
ncbi:OLC1v1005502C1 [Oldenlandia corymbosa var. corymbosa]|uniref:OLC1v1005502C1 n=1 Tax=Oldenlandia corymbosa var. corymbosa TaxID=529605 RepID=A0AAV1DES8_OLDCO|nr:OLC1v1005502C1 [Oldenlandia corymbosa var. corymbosa]